MSEESAPQRWSTFASFQSRVVPAFLFTIALLPPTNRLNSVLFPTFGHPTRATVKGRAGIAGAPLLRCSARLESPGCNGVAVVALVLISRLSWSCPRSRLCITVVAEEAAKGKRRSHSGAAVAPRGTMLR